MDNDQRLAGCSAVLQANPSDAVALANRGEAFRRKGDAERAVADFANSLELVPDNDRDFYACANMYFDAHDYALALADYDRAIKANASYAGVFNDRCMTHAILGQLQEALTDREQSLRMHPHDLYTLDSRALNYLKLGNPDAAIADYDAALNAKPALDSALFGRGLAKRKQVDVDGAERDIAAAKAINAGVAEVFVQYGVP